jgi:soluble lytic murein transglycosylase
MHYPLLYPAVIQKEARRAGVNPSLVAAVILHESEFRRKASSPVGARGLMQLMPDTAEWVDQHLEGNRVRRLDLFAPTTNVRLGATYLGYLAQRFRGDEVALLSAYNAGPQTTTEWLAGTADGFLRIPDIRYAETREYVRSVLKSEEMYRQLYPELNSAF